MRALTCNLQEFIKDQYGMEEDIMPADRRFFAAGYAIMLESIIMSEADSPDFGTFFCHRIAGIDNQHFNFFLWVNLGESRAI